MTERIALYRIWGEEDRLLYIGISKHFGKRWQEHGEAQPWWDEMRRMTVDGWYASRGDAAEVESTAIKAEKPKYNKVHAPAARNSRSPASRQEPTVDQWDFQRRMEEVRRTLVPRNCYGCGCTVLGKVDDDPAWRTLCDACWPPEWEGDFKNWDGDFAEVTR